MLLLQVQGIILHQDGSGQLRMVDMETQMEVKRMLAAQGISHGQAGETMVVHVSGSYALIRLMKFVLYIVVFRPRLYCSTMFVLWWNLVKFFVNFKLLVKWILNKFFLL